MSDSVVSSDGSILELTRREREQAGVSDDDVTAALVTVVERGDVRDVLKRPAHPYTQALLDCLPGRGTGDAIGGSFPSATDPPDGCRFAARCPHAIDDCRREHPALVSMDDDEDHRVACLYYRDGYDESPLQAFAATEASPTEEINDD